MVFQALVAGLEFLFLAGEGLLRGGEVFGEGGRLGLQVLELGLEGVGFGFEDSDLFVLLGGEILLGL